jgi:hypothetical protein
MHSHSLRTQTVRASIPPYDTRREDAMKRHITPLSVAALCLPIGTALAQDPDAVRTVEVDIYRDLDGPFDPAEYPNAFTIGAGALGAMADDFDPQGASSESWNLRYGWHPINLLTWELAYTGATDEMTVEERGDATVATLIETGAKMDLIPMSPLTPILAAGVGYGAFTAAQQDLSTLTVPLAGGLELKADNLLLGTRFTWRPTFFDQVALSDIGGDSWTWTADIGTRF